MTRDELTSGPLTLEKRKALVLQWQGLVIKYATIWWRRNPTLEFDDLFSAGNVGLVEAARKFDPGRGNIFTTLAVWHVENRIRECVRREMGGGLHIPGNDGFFRVEVRRFSQLWPDDDTQPGSRISERIVEQRPIFTEDFWDQVVQRLPKRHREVVLMRFRDGLLLKEIAASLQVTTARVGQLLQRSLQHLVKDRAGIQRRVFSS